MPFSRPSALDRRRRPRNPIARCCPEALEPRIAPAALFTFTDADGDLVTIKSSRGTDADLAAAITIGPADAFIEQIDLTNPIFAGTNLSVIAKSGGSAGDGLIHVGNLIATGIDLGKLTIDGDVGKLTAGDADGQTPAVKSLTIHSLGRYDVATGAPDLVSVLSGNVGKISIKTDVEGASLRVEQVMGVGGDVKLLSVGGSLIGTSAAESGRIDIEGRAKVVKVGDSIVGAGGPDSGVLSIAAGQSLLRISGSILGGEGTNSGTVFGGDGWDAIQIGGNVVGGTANQTGRFTVSDFGSLEVKGSVLGGPSGVSTGVLSIAGEKGRAVVQGDVIGSSGDFSGVITSDGNDLDSLVIGGSVLGGSVSNSGYVFTGNIRLLKIGGDVIGGDLTAGNLERTGHVEVSLLGKGTIGGSVIAGTDNGAGNLESSGSIHARTAIESLTIKGSLVGNDTHTASITARQPGIPLDGPLKPAIGKLTIGGDVRYAAILAGVNLDLVPQNGYSSIGVVKIGGSVQNSTIAAAVDPVDGRYGNADDIAFPDGLAIVSRIAKIVVGGQIVPSGVSVHGFVAEEIGQVIVNGRKLVLTAGPGNDVLPLGTLSNMTLQEVM